MVMPWKIFQKQLILFAPASSSAVVIRFWIVTWKVALFPCREASLMMMVVSSSSQSYTSDAKPENWSDSFIRSSFFLLYYQFWSWVDGSFLPGIMVSITFLQRVLLKLDSHVGCMISSWGCTFPYFPLKAFNFVSTYWHIFTWPN